MFGKDLLFVVKLNFEQKRVNFTEVKHDNKKSSKISVKHD